MRALNQRDAGYVVAATLMLLMTTQGAAAQSGNAPNAAADSSKSSEGDIIVTARRKEESAQTVPVSISVISSEALATKGIQSTNDLQKLVPGVILNGAGSLSNTTYTIRGQGKAVSGPGLPSVITYINEVPLPSIGSFAPTFDLDNVQILKGPQGTLFGRNTTGGAVLVYSKAPSYEIDGYLQADVGNYDKHSFQAAVNAPLIDGVLAVRFAGAIDRRDGYTRNASTGQRQDDLHSDAFRASVLFEPFEGLKNVLVFDYMQSDTNSLGFYPFEPLNPQTTAAVAQLKLLGDRVVKSNITPFDRETFWGLTNTTTLDLGKITFKNIFGYRYTKVHNFQNATGLGDSPLPNLGPALSGLGYVPGELGTLITTHNLSITRQYSDEVQFSGAVFNEAVSWLAGGFWVDEGPAGEDYLTLDIFRPTSPSPTLVSNVNNFLGGIWPVGSQVNTLYGDKSKALFGNVSVDMGKLVPAIDGITLNAGYRYTWDTESVCSNGSTSTTLATGDSIFTPFTGFKECRAFTGNALSPASAFDKSAKFKAPTYTLGVDYKLNQDIFFYFTTRRGYRAGGLNSPNLAPALSPFQTYQPQKVTDYEIGAHLKWDSGSWRARFNIAAFTGKFTGLQLLAAGITSQSGIPGVDASNAPSNSTLTINAGSARTKGVEIDGLISPFAGLSFTFGGSYLTQKYIKQEAPPILAPFFQSGEGFTGVPKWSYQAAIDYDLPIDDSIGKITLHADHYYIAEQFQGPALLPSYRLTDFAVQWSNMFGRPFSLTAYMDNAFDKKYVQDVILSTPSFGVYGGNYAAPRMYGLRLRYNIGPR